MSVVSGSVIVAGAAIDIAATWQLLRGRKETSATRIHAIASHARMLVAGACLISIAIPVAAVAFAFKAIESLAPEERAGALAERISEAMNGAILGIDPHVALPHHRSFPDGKVACNQAPGCCE
jgi:hypothetical protein